MSLNLTESESRNLVIAFSALIGGDAFYLGPSGKFYEMFQPEAEKAIDATYDLIERLGYVGVRDVTHSITDVERQCAHELLNELHRKRKIESDYRIGQNCTQVSLNLGEPSLNHKTAHALCAVLAFTRSCMNPGPGEARLECAHQLDVLTKWEQRVKKEDPIFRQFFEFD